MALPRGRMMPANIQNRPMEPSSATGYRLHTNIRLSKVMQMKNSSSMVEQPKAMQIPPSWKKRPRRTYLTMAAEPVTSAP